MSSRPWICFFVEKLEQAVVPCFPIKSPEKREQAPSLTVLQIFRSISMTRTSLRSTGAGTIAAAPTR